MKTSATVPITASAVAAWRPTPAQRAADRARKKRGRQLAAAATAPLPGPLREAFASFPRTVLGLKLVPVCAGHIAVLQQIDSPFLRAMRLAMLRARAAGKAEKKRIEKIAAGIQTTIENLGEVLYVFTHTYEELCQLLDSGPENFRAACRAALASLPPITEWQDVQTALGSWYMASYCTALAFESKRESPAGTINFPKPGRKTASAGSSTLSQP